MQITLKSLGWFAGVSPERVARLRIRRLPRWLVGGSVLIGFGAIEARTSWIQSSIFAAAARRLTYTVETGASTAILYPATGPYDQRLGYAHQGSFLKRLLGQWLRDHRTSTLVPARATS
jgi:hypothetical protein